MTDLLDAVDELTKPEIVHMAQKADTGAWLRAHTVEHPPLLQRMHDAVHPSSNSDTTSASQMSSRSPADLEALFQYAKMSAAIGSWCAIVKVRPGKDPVENLRRWYVAFGADPNSGDGEFYRREMWRWAHIIRKHLDPPKSFTVEGACPVCGKTQWGDMFNGGGPYPIVVEYRLDEDSQRPKDHTALCRACRTVWDGYDAVMELSEEVTEHRTEGNLSA